TSPAPSQAPTLTPAAAERRGGQADRAFGSRCTVRSSRASISARSERPEEPRQAGPDAGLDSAQRLAELGGDLSLGQAAVVRQLDRRALRLVELCDGPPDFPTQRDLLGARRRAGLRVGGLGWWSGLRWPWALRAGGGWSRGGRRCRPLAHADLACFGWARRAVPQWAQNTRASVTR